MRGASGAESPEGRGDRSAEKRFDAKKGKSISGSNPPGGIKRVCKSEKSGKRNGIGST
jgi:hypothetical protein